MEGMIDSIKKLCDEVKTVNGFCYLGDRLNSSGGCEVASVFPFFSRSWSELTDIRLNRVRVNEAQLYLKARWIHVEFVRGESWSIQCSKNVETGFMAMCKNKELLLGWQCILT